MCFQPQVLQTYSYTTTHRSVNLVVVTSTLARRTRVSRSANCVKAAATNQIKRIDTGVPGRRARHVHAGRMALQVPSPKASFRVWEHDRWPCFHYNGEMAGRSRTSSSGHRRVCRCAMSCQVKLLYGVARLKCTCQRAT